MFDPNDFSYTLGDLKYINTAISRLNNIPNVYGWNKILNLTPHKFNNSSLMDLAVNSSFIVDFFDLRYAHGSSFYGQFPTGVPKKTTNLVAYVNIQTFKQYKEDNTRYTIYSPMVRLIGNTSNNNNSNNFACFPVETWNSALPYYNFLTDTLYDDYYLVIGQQFYEGASLPRNAVSRERSLRPIVLCDFSSILPVSGEVARQDNQFIINANIDSGYQVNAPGAFNYVTWQTLRIGEDIATPSNYLTTADRPRLTCSLYPSEMPFITLVADFDAGYFWIDDDRYIFDIELINNPYPDAPFLRPFRSYVTQAPVELYLFKTKEDIFKWYNSLGIPASDDANAIINSPIEDLDPGYTPPGVPTNPPIIDSFPDNSSDPVTFPVVNITAATLAGCMVYDYTKAISVLNWLRSNTFFQDINRLFNNPIDAIYGFLLYPFDIVAHDTAHVTESPTTSILNVSTDIPTYLLDGGYNFTINGGEYYYTPYYGNFADYAFVDYSLYIPFFGITPLNPDDVVGHTLAVKYAFDISSGACTIFLTSDGQLLRILNGSLAQAIPIISSNNNERILNLTLSALGAVGGVGKGIAESVATQNPLPAITSVGDAILDVGKTAISNPYRQAISGRLGVDTSFYAPYNCYLIINNHYYSPAAAQNAQMGAPSNYSVSLNDLTGYFSVKSIDISSTTATVAELNEIEGLLKTGVYRS